MTGDNFFSDTILQTEFDQRGIVLLPLLSQTEMAELIRLYEDIGRPPLERNFHSTMFVNDSNYRKQIDQGIRKILLPKIEQLLPDYRMLFSNFIVKSPGPDTGVGIHQDWNFAAPEYTTINFWIPLIDIDEQTGLFYALDASHKSFNNIRYTPYEEDRYAGLEEYIANNATSYQIKAGTAIAYHGALVHFSAANISKHNRMAVGAVLIPREAKNLHYYKRSRDREEIEVYEVSENFYHRFDFFEEPVGEKKIGEVLSINAIPSLNFLIKSTTQ